MNTDTQLAVVSDLVPNNMEQALAFSSRMAEANLIPAHLKKSPADCLRVVLIAARWQMDPFAVADKTSVINGKIMFEGQLCSAVVNSRGNLKRKLSYDFKGEGNARVLTVSGTIQGEDAPRTIELTHALALKINRNGQVGINPDQQMTYIGARMWARRHTPELMLGVYTPEEMESEEPINVTPAAPIPPESRPDPATLRKGRKSGANASPPVEATVTPVAETPAASAPSVSAGTNPPARTSLEKDEKAAFLVTVLSSSYEDFGTKDTPRHGCKAQVDGEFSAMVYDLAGGHKPEGEPAKILPIWAAGSKVRLELTGKFSKVQKVVLPIVESVAPAPTQTVEANGALGLD